MNFIEPDENRQYSDFRNKGRIKKCFYCDGEDNIVTSHSISESKCLSHLVESVGKNKGIYGFEHLKFRTDENWFHRDKFGYFELVGINKASTFKGFCAPHDQTLFKILDDFHFDRTSAKQKFLYCFRAFAYAYHKKIEREKSCKMESDYKNNHYMTIQNDLHGIETGLNVDIGNYPHLMKEWLKSEDYIHLTHFYCKTKCFHPIASSSMCEPTFSILGNRINDYCDIDTPLNHIIINIVPEKECNHTHILVSAFANQPKSIQFINELEQIYKVNKESFGTFLTTLLVFHTENTYMSPSMIEELPYYTKRNLLLNLRHISTEGIEEELLDKPIRGSLNLFADVL